MCWSAVPCFTVLASHALLYCLWKANTPSLCHKCLSRAIATGPRVTKHLPWMRCVVHTTASVLSIRSFKTGGTASLSRKEWRWMNEWKDECVNETEVWIRILILLASWLSLDSCEHWSVLYMRACRNLRKSSKTMLGTGPGIWERLHIRQLLWC